MRVATIRSVCECQAGLNAEIDDRLQALEGTAREYGSNVIARAPVQTLPDTPTRFHAAWTCPFCVRNVLRSFDTGALAWRSVSAQRLPNDDSSTDLHIPI